MDLDLSGKRAAVVLLAALLIIGGVLSMSLFYKSIAVDTTLDDGLVFGTPADTPYQVGGNDRFSKQKAVQASFNIDTINSGGDADVIYENGTYYMVLKDADQNAGEHSIHMASSDDPAANNWTHEGKVIDETETNWTYVSDPGFVKHNGTYYVYASASNNTDDSETKDIVVATSDSPTSGWEYQGSTGITTDAAGSWASAGVGEPDPIYDPETEQFVMSLTGKDSSGVQTVGYATSDDGLTYTYPDTNPIIETSWRGTNLAEDQIILTDGQGTYAIYYNSDGGNLGKAISTDLDNWTNVDQPVMTKGPESYDADGVYAPTMTVVNGTAHMWYSAFDSDSDSTNDRGYATGRINYSTGQTEVEDLSSAGNNAPVNVNTVAPPDLTANAVAGRALDFDSAHSEGLALKSVPKPSLSNGFSVAGWVYTDTLAANQDVFIYDDSSTKYAWLDYTDTAYRWVVYDGSSSVSVSGGTPEAGVWKHICGTLATDGTMTLYVDGSSIGTTSVSSIASGGDYWRVGYTVQGGRHYDGLLDEPRFWTRELSSSEVTELVDNPQRPFE